MKTLGHSLTTCYDCKWFGTPLPSHCCRLSDGPTPFWHTPEWQVVDPEHGHCPAWEPVADIRERWAVRQATDISPQEYERARARRKAEREAGE